MLAVKHGDLSKTIEINHTYGNDRNELYDISMAFNNMIKDLNNHIKNECKAEIAMQRFKFNMLQYQINPHFLCNTLESVRMKALLNNDDEVAEMLFILSRVYRNVVKGSGVVSIKHEAENVISYLRLCAIRYKSLFNYNLSIDSSVLGYQIVQHTLLVLVENFFTHGLDTSKADNHITIEVLCT
ncbi:hypothetical protein FACS1894184_13460 [Clostridia bacterium]|nr:hypothetical protein FACS1894184_13460 [Clostridia bacterium]